MALILEDLIEDLLIENLLACGHTEGAGGSGGQVLERA